MTLIFIFLVLSGFLGNYINLYIFIYHNNSSNIVKILLLIAEGLTQIKNMDERF